MTKLRFCDGMEFETDGPLRIEERSDGLYVIGEGMLCACDSHEKAEDLIRDLEARLGRKDGDA